MKETLYKVLSAVFAVLIVVAIIYGSSIETEEIRCTYEDDTQIEMTDGAKEAMLYFYNQADEQLRN